MRCLGAVSAPASGALGSASQPHRPRSPRSRALPRLTVRAQQAGPGWRAVNAGAGDCGSDSGFSRRRTPRVSSHWLAQTRPEVAPPGHGGAQGGGGHGGDSGDSGHQGGGDDKPPRNEAWRLLLLSALSCALTALSLRQSGSSASLLVGVGATGITARACCARLLRGRSVLLAVLAPASLGAALFPDTPEEVAARVTSRDPHSVRWPAADEQLWSTAEEEEEETPLPGCPGYSQPDEPCKPSTRPDWRGNLVSTLAASFFPAQRAAVEATVLDPHALRSHLATAARVTAIAAGEALQTAGFSCDAASGAASTHLGHRFHLGNGPKDDILLTVSLPAGSDKTAPLVSVQARGCTAVVSAAGGLVSLDVPPVMVADGCTLRPSWQAGLVPQLEAAWSPAPWTLPRCLSEGSSHCSAVLALHGARLSATHARRRSAGPGAQHGVRMTLAAGVGSKLKALNARVVYKLRLLPEGVTLGAAFGAGDGALAPAVAFAKTRISSGAALRVQVGLASSTLGAELSWREKGARQPGRWTAQAAFADGRLRSATLERKVDL